MDRPVEFISVGKGLVRQMIRLEVVPDHFDVAEFRRILGQPLDGEPVCAAAVASESLLVWIGPLSSTSTTGLAGCPAWDHRDWVELLKMGDVKSLLRLVGLVWT